MSFNVRGLRSERVRADEAALLQVKARLERLARDQAAADALLAEAKRAADDIARETRELQDVERNMTTKLASSRAALVQECLSTLPDDVLRCVFSEARQAGGREPHTPFALAAVCARWRQVALDHASLWSDIVIFVRGNLLGDRRHGYLKNEYTRAALLLERSRMCPLDIHVSAEGLSGDGDALQTFTQLVGLLGTHVSRWKTVDLTIPMGVRRTVLNFLKGPTPLLVSLQALGHPVSNSPDSSEAGYFPFAPVLEALDIGYLGMGCSTRYTYPVLKTLDLSYGACTDQQLYNYLRMCSHSLQKLVLGVQLDAAASIEPIALPKLEHLAISPPSFPLIMTPISSCIAMPVLDHLELNLRPVEIGDEIVSFIDAISPTVRSLSLLCAFTADTFPFLARLHQLEQLAFIGLPGCIHNSVLQLLATSDPPIWPRLTRIKNVRYVADQVWSSEAILQFIASRNIPAGDSEGPGADVHTARPCKLVEVGFDEVSSRWLVAEVDRLLEL
ncbi:hypothetical protein AURDEDRAFT_175333 [Auricularia subglabra TFB-10046 SS5]|nr:hypothetical protein AURDEDRAFT_175333 [Auricularia subglabra TFB-10046 SS5]